MNLAFYTQESFWGWLLPWLPLAASRQIINHAVVLSLMDHLAHSSPLPSGRNMARKGNLDPVSCPAPRPCAARQPSFPAVGFPSLWSCHFLFPDGQGCITAVSCPCIGSDPQWVCNEAERKNYTGDRVCQKYHINKQTEKHSTSMMCKLKFMSTR